MARVLSRNRRNSAVETHSETGADSEPADGGSESRTAAMGGVRDRTGRGAAKSDMPTPGSKSERYAEAPRLWRAGVQRRNGASVLEKLRQPGTTPHPQAARREEQASSRWRDHRPRSTGACHVQSVEARLPGISDQRPPGDHSLGVRERQRGALRESMRVRSRLKPAAREIEQDVQQDPLGTVPAGPVNMPLVLCADGVHRERHGMVAQRPIAPDDVGVKKVHRVGLFVVEVRGGGSAAVDEERLPRSRGRERRADVLATLLGVCEPSALRNRGACRRSRPAPGSANRR